MDQVLKEKMELIFDRYRYCKMHEDDEDSKAFVEHIDKVVNNLPDIEGELIYERYMVKNARYIIDRNIYQFKMTEPIAAPLYIKLRTRAFEAIAAMLKLNPGASND